MEERIVRKISDVIDMSYLSNETRWEDTGRIRKAIRNGGLAGWCCRGDALVDVFMGNTGSWSTGNCILGFASNFSMSNRCLDNIEHCSRHKGAFDGSSAEEKLRRAFSAVEQAGYRVRLSDCKWRNGS